MTPEALSALMEATWPPAGQWRDGPWMIREGREGGKRVAAATAAAPFAVQDIAIAEAAMRSLNQTPLFVIRDGDALLDDALAAQGYDSVDPVLAYSGDCAALAAPVPPALSGFAHWPPLAITCEVWAEGGIGPARVAVMHRVQGPKAAILSRSNDRPTGAAFVAAQGDFAMLHALEVIPEARRQGSARNILRLAAGWALQQRATRLCVVVTVANQPARALYEALGMVEAGHYHYRQKQP